MFLLRALHARLPALQERPKFSAKMRDIQNLDWGRSNHSRGRLSRSLGWVGRIKRFVKLALPFGSLPNRRPSLSAFVPCHDEQPLFKAALAGRYFIHHRLSHPDLGIDDSFSDLP